MTETAPPLPAVKVKAPRNYKSGGPLIKSPIATTLAGAKRRVASPHADAMPSIIALSPLDKDIKTIRAPPIAAKAKLNGKPPKVTTKAPPKAQAGGMSPNDLKACRNALKKLQTHKAAFFFKQPVDPIRDNAPKFVVLSSSF